MTKDRIYLDHAATTPVCAAAQKAMRPWLTGAFGNPSSLHAEGRKAKDAIDQAREILSSALGCLFAECLFTGSGTEAANLAILGAAREHAGGPRNRILLGAGEHHCVLHTAPVLRQLGYEVEWIPIDRIGRVRLDALEPALDDRVLLVSVMDANNEFGTLQPVEDVSRLAAARGALFHCDAVQTLPWKLHLPPADLVTYSAHKIGGPKGVGALYVRAGVKIKPWIVGGGQERELRAGTENVAGIAGFGAAVRALQQSLMGTAPGPEAAAHFAARLAEDPNWVPTVPNPEDRLPGHVHGRFPGIQAESMLIRIDRMGIAAGSGAACSSGSLEPSHVLTAAGYRPDQAKEGLRFSFGRETKVDEGNRAAEVVLEAAQAISRGQEQR